MTSIHLVIDARNPGEYLAVCGLVELISHIDRNTTSAWARRTGMVPEVPSAAADVCEVHSDIDEKKFAKELGMALGSQSAWRSVTDLARVPLPDAVGAWTAGIELTIPCQKDVLVIDHWYERAFVKGDEIVQRHGKRDGKGRWKLWAGRHDSIGVPGLLLELVESAANLTKTERLQDLLTHVVSGSSGLKLDPATTRASLDRGVSANDAKDDAKGIVRPFLELLGTIGQAAFFPPRRYGNAAPEGTVGIRKRTFRYSTWSQHLPLTIARLCARDAGLVGIDRVSYKATMGWMGQYSYLKFSRPGGVPGVAHLSDEPIEEEDT